MTSFKKKKIEREATLIKTKKKGHAQAQKIYKKEKKKSNITAQGRKKK